LNSSLKARKSYIYLGNPISDMLNPKSELGNRIFYLGIPNSDMLNLKSKLGNRIFYLGIPNFFIRRPK